MVNNNIKSGTGSVGRNRRINERYHTDEEFRKKYKNRRKEYYKKHKEYYKKMNKEWAKKLSEFKNRRCKICDKLLDYKSKTLRCIQHRWIKL